MTVDYTNRNRDNSVRTEGSAVEYDQGLRDHMLRVYNHMAIGIAVTGLVAWFTANSEAMIQMLFGGPQMYLVMFAPLIMVFYLGFKMPTMSENGAKTAFYLYSALMGLSLSVIFLAYTGASVARVFFITAAMFGALSLYGYTTKRDLSGMGTFLFMGLIGIIIASIVNIFMKSEMMHFVVSVAAIIIFVGLTAYDTQKIKHTYYQIGAGGAMLGKAAIMGALSLYLDFINLMIHLLHFLGDRR